MFGSLSYIKGKVSSDLNLAKLMKATQGKIFLDIIERYPFEYIRYWSKWNDVTMMHARTNHTYIADILKPAGNSCLFDIWGVKNELKLHSKESYSVTLTEYYSNVTELHHIVSMLLICCYA